MKHWLSAARLRTLPLALAGLALGNFLGAYSGNFQWTICIFTLLTALLLQILSNFANDYGDFKNGADNEHRIGPQRTVQAGTISEKSMKTAIIIMSLLAVVCGIIALYFSRNNVNLYWLGGMFAIGLIAIAAAIKYTATPNPYGYKGLGDIAVLIFFGLVAVLGSAYLQSGFIELIWILPALAFGFLATGVLNLNNMRDIENDGKVGKITIPVRLGLHKAKEYHNFLIISASALFIIFAIVVYTDWQQYLFLITLGTMIVHLNKVKNRVNYSELNPLLKELSLSAALVALAFGISLIIR